jgi:hypothetical protein
MLRKPPKIRMENISPLVIIMHDCIAVEMDAIP